MQEVLIESSVVDFSAWVSLFSSFIGGVFFLIILVILKNFLSKGFSWAIAEFLLNYSTKDVRVKMCKYFANGDIILTQLKNMDALNKKIEKVE